MKQAARASALTMLALALASAQIGVYPPNSATPNVANNSLMSVSNGTLIEDRSDPALAAWNAALNNFALANNATPSKVVNALLIGDSWTEGGGAFAAFSSIWAQQLQRDLQTRFGYHGTGIIPIHTSSGAWTLTGTWNQISALGPTQPGASAFNSLYQASGAANVASFGSATGPVIKYFGDHLNVYYATWTDTAAGFGVAIDGGASTTCGATTTPSATPAVCTLTATAGWHTAVITPPATGNCYLRGAEWTSGTTGVSVHNYGRGGARAEAFGSAPATELAWVPTIPGGIQLAIISLGINDYGNSTDPAMFQTYLQHIVNYLQSLPSAPSILILDQGNTSQTGTSFGQDQYRSIEESTAIAYNCAYLSVGARWGTFSHANTTIAVMAADGIHPNDSGYYDIARMIERRIIEAPGANGLAITPGGNLGLGNPAHNFGIETGTTAIGAFTLGTGAFNSSGFNTAIGYQAGNAETTGAHNTCIGRFACGSGPTSGSFDTAVGDNASFGTGTGGSVQLGGGTNSTNNTIQFQTWNFLDSSGNGKLQTLNLASTTGPTCDATHRGTYYYTAGATGVKDNLQVCAKDASDAYALRTIY